MNSFFSQEKFHSLFEDFLSLFYAAFLKEGHTLSSMPQGHEANVYQKPTLPTHKYKKLKTPHMRSM